MMFFVLMVFFYVVRIEWIDPCCQADGHFYLNILRCLLLLLMFTVILLSRNFVPMSFLCGFGCHNAIAHCYAAVSSIIYLKKPKLSYITIEVIFRKISKVLHNLYSLICK
jgi:ABC-type uncharacterized transport system fused permease/ATPase subunit